LAAYYDKQKETKEINNKHESDYYHTRAIPSLRKKTVFTEPGKEASLEFQGNAA